MSASPTSRGTARTEPGSMGAGTSPGGADPPPPAWRGTRQWAGQRRAKWSDADREGPPSRGGVGAGAWGGGAGGWRGGGVLSADRRGVGAGAERGDGGLTPNCAGSRVWGQPVASESDQLNRAPASVRPGLTGAGSPPASAGA